MLFFFILLLVSFRRFILLLVMVLQLFLLLRWVSLKRTVFLIFIVSSVLFELLFELL